jgi:NAD(P)-dependent dehydrogenase (short-subunit alcohol dehydrogenase family)
VSAFLIIKYATPLMTTGGGGSIVCISSDAAKVPWPFLATYNTSKSGVEGLVKGAALELAHLGIRVNAVRPGLVKTAGTADGTVQERARHRPVPGGKAVGAHGRAR